MQLTSPVFAHEALIPARYTCDGENVNPPLVIAGMPEQAVSLVLIMDDPDVPKHLRPDGMWDHWVVFDIPPQTREIAENTEPEGVHGLGTGNNLEYYGPCPPDREHRYFFRLYALDCKLNLPQGVGKAEVEQAMSGHILAEAQLMGRYNRPR